MMIPVMGVGAALVSWIFLLATPLALLPEILGASRGEIVTVVALGATLLAVVSPLFEPELRKPKKPRRASKPVPATPAPRRQGSGSHQDVSMTRRQQQHLWYRDNSDLDWRDREQAESWGMDSDTYKSNWLESD